MHVRDIPRRSLRPLGFWLAVLIGFAGLAAGCGSDGPPIPPDGFTADGGAPLDPKSGIHLVIGEGVSHRAADSIAKLLSEASHQVVTPADPRTLPKSLRQDALVVAIGKSDVASAIVPNAEVDALAPEAFVVRSGALRGAPALVAVGAPAKQHVHGNLGTLHAAYTLLESLGFAFMHPLAPTIPTAITLPVAPIEIREAPRWDSRIMHLHTQHPLELTELLQGFGKVGHEDQAGFDEMLEEWDRFLEWEVANGQNGVEWILLSAESFESFADSALRQHRFRTLVEHGHAFGMAVGVDAPIAFNQQHSFRLLRETGELESELRQIRERIDWLMAAGFDFLGTESGTSEFTHPAPDRMLSWMNEVARHLDEAHDHAPATIKIHCSTGQVADGYTDPGTNTPTNFNMLPRHADPRLGVLAHTVQHYGLDDPAPTYGNKDFGYMLDFLLEEVGRRPVYYYPETAYWVSFDVDVPLFLPVYAERRLSDLRLIAQKEDAGLAGRGAHAGGHMDGQFIFSSGWEWGYWLNDVVAARASWNPHVEADDGRAAMHAILTPLEHVFGEAGPEIVDWINDVAEAERALLIGGRVGGQAPNEIVRRNGQAYLQGWETWDDVNTLIESLPTDATMSTQPSKLGLVEMRNPVHPGPGYSKEIEPLLREMELTFGGLASRGEALRARVPAPARDLFDDLADAMQMTVLRARQVHGLYDYVDGALSIDQSKRRARLADARTALDSAGQVVALREPRYRVPADRIAAWRPNPTAYEWGYLWTVRRLHYWWRDEGKAVDRPVFPCYMNIINPVDVAFGEGMGTNAAKLFGEVLTVGDSRGCLGEPEREPRYPQDDLRSRP